MSAFIEKTERAEAKRIITHYNTPICGDDDGDPNRPTVAEQMKKYWPKGIRPSKPTQTEGGIIPTDPAPPQPR